MSLELLNEWGYQLPTPTIKEQKEKLQGYMDWEETSLKSNINHMCIQDAISNGIFMHILILHILFKNIPLELFSDRLTDGNYFFQKKITFSLLLPSPLTLFWEPNGTPTRRSNCWTTWVYFFKKIKDTCYAVSLYSRYKNATRLFYSCCYLHFLCITAHFPKSLLRMETEG